MSRYLIIAFFFIAELNGITAQNFNRPIPPGLFPYEFISYTPVNGYFLTGPYKFGTPMNSPNHKPACPILLDSNGYVAWYLPNHLGNIADFKFFPNHSKLTFNRNRIGGIYFYVMDMNFNIIDSICNTITTTSDGHEFQILNNGNYIIGAAKDSVMDLSAYTFNGTQGSDTTHVKCYIIQEFDAAHNLVFEWNSIDHIFPTEAYDAYGYNPNSFPYCHGNAIEEDVDGNLLVSFRHLDAVYKINHTSGNVIWRLGGQSSDFTFTNDVGFGGQHDIRRLPNGDISLFDNTNNHPPPHQTRAVQYTLDTIAWTATRSWEYIYLPSFFSVAMGNHQVTPDNYHLINYGLNFRPKPSFVLTDHTGNLLTEVFCADSTMNYRTHFYNVDLNLPRPEILCYNNGTNIELFAPNGFTNYVWSTGETTSSIFVNSTDTFQVWVNYGDGMMGSFPFVVSDLANDCQSGVGLETEVFAVPTIVSYYNLLGQEVQYPIGGNMYITLYSNGKNRLIFIPK